MSSWWNAGASIVSARRSTRVRKEPLKVYSEASKNMISGGAATISTRLRSRSLDINHDNDSSLRTDDNNDCSSSEGGWFDAPSTSRKDRNDSPQQVDVIDLVHADSKEPAKELPSSSDEEYVDASEHGLGGPGAKQGLRTNAEHWKVLPATRKQNSCRKHSARRRSHGELDTLARLSSLDGNAIASNIKRSPRIRKRKRSLEDSVLMLSTENGQGRLRKRLETPLYDDATSSSSDSDDSESSSDSEASTTAATLLSKKQKVAAATAPDEETWTCLKCNTVWPMSRARCPPPCRAWKGGKRTNIVKPKTTNPSPCASKLSARNKKRRREAVNTQESDMSTKIYSAPGRDCKEELVHTLNKATVPKFHSIYWKIWKRLGKQKTHGPLEDATKTTGDSDTSTVAKDNALTIHPSAEHNFCLVHHSVSTKVAAGMYRSALKYCHDVLLAWYAQAQKEIGLQLLGRSNHDAIRSIDSVRTGLAGMWCVYANLLIELSSRALERKVINSAVVVGRRPKTKSVGGARRRIARGTAVSTNEKGRNETDSNVISESGNGELFSAEAPADPSVSADDVADHALSIIRNAACCPIVGNHPWIAIAQTRILLARSATAQTEKLQSVLASAIKICKVGIYNSTPLPYLVKAQEKSSLQRLDSTKIITFVSQHLPTQSIIEDSVSNSALEQSFLSVNKAIPEVLSVCSQRRRYFFVDPRGARVLCSEVNRLSRLQEKLQKAQSICVTTNDSSCSAQSYGLEALVHFRALNVDLDRSVLASQPLATESLADKKATSFPVPGSQPMAKTAFAAFDPQSSSGHGNSTVVGNDEESSSESTPVLITSDNDEDTKGECISKCTQHGIKPRSRIEDGPQERVNNKSVSACDVDRTKDSNIGGPGSLCSMIESANPLKLRGVEQKLPMDTDGCDRKMASKISRQFGTCLAKDCISQSFDPDEGRGHSIENLTDLLDYAIELFAVSGQEVHTAEELEEKSMFGDEDYSPDVPHFAGQVGMRCLHCRDENLFGACGSFTFPSSCDTLHKDAWFLCLGHFDSCANMPLHVRQHYQEFREKVPMDSPGFQEYWRDAATCLRPKRNGQGICWSNRHRNKSAT